jgi:hypothetical protein
VTHHEVGVPGLKGILSFSVPDQRSGKVCCLYLSFLTISMCGKESDMCIFNDAIVLTSSRFVFIHLTIAQ